MASFRKLVASTLSTDFRKACQIVNDKIDVLKPHEVLVKARYYVYSCSNFFCKFQNEAATSQLEKIREKSASLSLCNWQLKGLNYSKTPALQEQNGKINETHRLEILKFL